MANQWVIKTNSKDATEVDLLRSGRQVRAEVSPAEAKRYIKAHGGTGDTVFTEDHEGYRVRLSGSSLRHRKR